MTEPTDKHDDRQPKADPDETAEPTGTTATPGEPTAAPGPDKGEKARKERVLHTRIPEVLEHELKQLATSLRVPVSNLVRTILQDAMEAAEAVGRAAEHELRGAADRLARERERMQDAAVSRGAQLGRAAAETLHPVAATPKAPSTTAKPEPPTDPKGAPPPSPPASALAEDTPPPAGPGADDALFAGVLGYQSFILALETRCARCEKTLAVGETAYLGVRDAPGPRVIIGPECLPGAPG